MRQFKISHGSFKTGILQTLDIFEMQKLRSANEDTFHT